MGLSVTETKYLRAITSMRKDLFWLIVLEVPGHRRVVLCFWTFRKAEHHGWKAWWRRVVHSYVARKQKVKKGQGQGISFQD